MEDESKETVSLSWIWWAKTCKIGQSVLRNLKLYSLNFAIAHTQKKIVLLIRIGHAWLALKHQENLLITWNKLINQFRTIKFMNCLLLTKTNREFQMFGNLRFITIFHNILLPNMSDISEHYSFHFSTCNAPSPYKNAIIHWFSYEDSSVKISGWTIWWKTNFWQIDFLND